MEPNVMQMYSSSSPPPLDDIDTDTGVEEDDFGDFGGFSLGIACTGFGITGSDDLPPSLRLIYPKSTLSTDSPNCSFNYPIEKSQPASTVTSGLSSRHTSSVPDACLPQEETGFADFAVFSEQTVHQWCCGFSPIGSTAEHLDGRIGETDPKGNLDVQHCDPAHGVDMEANPGGCLEVKGKNATEVKHCEQSNAEKQCSAHPPSQDLQPQDVAAALTFSLEDPSPVEKVPDKPVAYQEERRSSLNLNINRPQTPVLDEERQTGQERGQRKRSKSRSLTTPLCESDSGHFASHYDTVSLDCPSEVFDPILSSVHPQEEKYNGKVKEDQDESRNTSLVTANLSLSQSRKEDHFDISELMPQETTVPSIQSKSRIFIEGFADFEDNCIEPNGDPIPVEIVDGEEQYLGSLPLSDSFADFCSASVEGDEEDYWSEYSNQRHQIEGNSWAQFGEEGSPIQTEGDAVLKQDRQRGASNVDRYQDPMPRHIQRVLNTSFPEVLPASGGQHEEEVPTLSNFLQAQNHHPEDGRQEGLFQSPEMHGLQWERMDINNAVGLKFQWGGSHTNKILLMCLGMDTRNIVFTGKRKQPLVVPAFASSLGMLEPTKESVPTVCHPRCTAVTTQESPVPRGKQGPLADSIKEAPSSSQSDWISSGLCNSQDGTSPHPASPFRWWN